MISIIIPVYNSQKYLKQCIDSIKAQNYTDLEVICINDGSTDGSLSILNSYVALDSRIKVYTKPNEGKGAASARNFGFSKSSGEYVMFLDSDDFFEPNLVGALVKKADATDADLVICSADRYDDKAQEIIGKYTHIELDKAPEGKTFSYKDCPERIFQIGDILVWNKLYRRELIEANDLYFEEIPISDDQMVPALSLVIAERIAVVDKPFVHYRFNTGNSQVDSQNRHPESAYQASYTIVKRMREYGVYDQVRQSYINHAVLLMREYFDKMTELKKLEFLYDKYRNEIFPMLDAVDLEPDYFYETNVGSWYRMICENSLDEILFSSARAYGSPWNTAILRFQVPYERIERGADIVLVGKGIIGRYWYAQLLLSGYCNVAAWVDDEGDIPNDMSPNEILIAR